MKTITLNLPDVMVTALESQREPKVSIEAMALVVLVAYYSDGMTVDEAQEAKNQTLEYYPEIQKILHMPDEV